MYFGILKNGRSTDIKKLDSSKQPDQEFLAQVQLLFLLLLDFFRLDFHAHMKNFTGFHGVKAEA